MGPGMSLHKHTARWSPVALNAAAAADPATGSASAGILWPGALPLAANGPTKQTPKHDVLLTTDPDAMVSPNWGDKEPARSVD
jgi:hypothetical protein